MSEESPAALSRFEFTSGLHRGAHLALYPTCLVYRSEFQLETMALARMAALKVAFERDSRRLGWGAGLIGAALLLLALAAPLGIFAGREAAELASGAGVSRALYGFFRAIEVLAALMPAAALLCALGGAALAVLGWRGYTVLTVSLGGSERQFAVRGRDTLLLDFAEMVTDRLLGAAR